jgi:hypothetical protein
LFKRYGLVVKLQRRFVPQPVGFQPEREKKAGGGDSFAKLKASSAAPY